MVTCNVNEKNERTIKELDPVTRIRTNVELDLVNQNDRDNVDNGRPTSTNSIKDVPAKADNDKRTAEKMQKKNDEKKM